MAIRGRPTDTTVASKHLLVDKEYKKDEDTDRPANLNLRLGFYADEYGWQWNGQ